MAIISLILPIEPSEYPRRSHNGFVGPEELMPVSLPCVINFCAKFSTELKTKFYHDHDKLKMGEIATAHIRSISSLFVFHYFYRSKLMQMRLLEAGGLTSPSVASLNS
jgi:hypothetical protein